MYTRFDLPLEVMPGERVPRATKAKPLPRAKEVAPGIVVGIDGKWFTAFKCPMADDEDLIMIAADAPKPVLAVDPGDLDMLPYKIWFGVDPGAPGGDDVVMFDSKKDYTAGLWHEKADCAGGFGVDGNVWHRQGLPDPTVDSDLSQRPLFAPDSIAATPDVKPWKASEHVQAFMAAHRAGDIQRALAKLQDQWQLRDEASVLTSAALADAFLGIAGKTARFG
jgi:hypothetical protein